MELCKQQNDIEEQSNIWCNILGISLIWQDKFDEALVATETALELTNSGNLSERAVMLGTIGYIFQRKKEYGEALEKYKQSLKLFEKTSECLHQAELLLNIGDLYAEQGKIEFAHNYFDDSVEKIEASNNLSGQAKFLRYIIWAYAMIGERERALELSKKCLRLRKRSGNLVDIASTLNAIGYLYLLVYSDLNAAYDYFVKALKIRERLKLSTAVEQTRSNIVAVYLEQGKINEAFIILQDLLDNMDERRIQRQKHLFRYLARAYFLKEDFQSALLYYKKSVELCKKQHDIDHESHNLNHIGEVYVALGDYDKAIELFTKSLKSQPHNYQKAKPLNNLAEVYYRQGEFIEAINQCEKSFAFSRKYGSPIQTGITLNLMAKISLKENNNVQAHQYAKEAVRIFKHTGSHHLTDAEKTLQLCAVLS